MEISYVSNAKETSGNSVKKAKQKKIIINENDDVDVIFKFQRDDNGGLGFGLGNQKDVENGEFSTSAVILMVDSAVLSNFLRPQKQVVSWTEK